MKENQENYDKYVKSNKRYKNLPKLLDFALIRNPDKSYGAKFSDIQTFSTPKQIISIDSTRRPIGNSLQINPVPVQVYSTTCYSCCCSYCV